MSLKSLSIARDERNRDFGFEGDGILSWPSLNRLELKNMSVISIDDLGPLPSTSVTHLIIKESSIDPAALRILIENCAALEIFEFNDADAERRENPAPWTLPRQLVEKLLYHKENLKEMKLNFFQFEERGRRNPTPRGYAEDGIYIYSLRTFTTLVTLKISCGCMLFARREDNSAFVDALPPALQHLSLLAVEEYHYPFVRGLAGCLDRLSKLREVMVFFDLSSAEVENFQALKQYYIAKGIKYTLRFGID